MGISVSRFQAIKNAFKKAYAKSWGRATTDQAVTAMAMELKEVFPPVTFGEGPVSGTDTVSQFGDLYCDRTTGQFYQYTVAGWAIIAGGGGGGYILPIASAGTLGGVKVGSGLAINGSGVLSATATPYVLPTASAGTLGGVKVGTGLAIDGSGNLSVTYTYTLPIASAGTLGGVKVGSGLAIDGAGVLSATATPYVLPTASAGTLGGVKVGTGLAIDGSGVLSASATGDMSKATYDTNNDGFVDEVALASSALPVASAAYSGRFHYYAPGGGTEGNLYFCMQNSAGGYEWVIVGQSS